MKLKISAFGIAKDIVGQRSLSLDVNDVGTLAELKNELSKRFPEFRKLVSLTLAVNESYESDNYLLQENDHVVIIPPVSGG